MNSKFYWFTPLVGVLLIIAVVVSLIDIPERNKVIVETTVAFLGLVLAAYFLHNYKQLEIWARIQHPQTEAVRRILESKIKNRTFPFSVSRQDLVYTALKVLPPLDPTKQPYWENWRVLALGSWNNRTEELQLVRFMSMEQLKPIFDDHFGEA